MPFTTADEVQTYIGGIFRAAFEDPELGPALRETGLTLQFQFSDPDATTTIVTSEGLVIDGDVDQAPSATMIMAADVGNGYWQGKVSLPLAMARGRIRVKGNVQALLRLAPLSKALVPLYVARLKEDGRDDLLL